MISLWMIRVGFVIVCTFTAYSLGKENSFWLGMLGFLIGVGVVTFETVARRVSLKGLSSGVFGIILGLLLAKLFGEILHFFVLPGEISYNLRVFVTIIFVYLGMTLGIKGRQEFNLVIPYVRFKRQELKEDVIIVDTSSIIDGRIVDIVKTGFIEGQFIVPRLVLNELQSLADSTDHLKRQRGKRGIEILHSLKKEPNIEVVIYEDELAGERLSVDIKIVKITKNLNGKILTCDYNLNRIAKLEGVRVLNINDLANALKPIYLPGERFSLRLIKEGKELNQAIGYLEDGTMVVVENAKWLIGKTVEVEVTSSLQSPSGRIIFTKLLG